MDGCGRGAEGGGGRGGVGGRSIKDSGEGCRLVGGGTGGVGTRCRCKKNMRQQQTKHLRSWGGPSANGSDGGSKKCGWDVGGGRGRSGRGAQLGGAQGRRSERMRGG